MDDFQNPELLDMSAFGQPQGPTLTPSIARRVTALKGVQHEHAKVCLLCSVPWTGLGKRGERERERDRKRERQKERETERERDRKRERQKERGS
jgi:hypothetical protein